MKTIFLTINGALIMMKTIFMTINGALIMMKIIFITIYEGLFNKLRVVDTPSKHRFMLIPSITGLHSGITPTSQYNHIYR